MTLIYSLAYFMGDVVNALVALGVLPLPCPLSFQHVGQFPGGVLWLGPTTTAALLALHAETVRRLDAAGIEIWALYRPDAWVPHSTLSMVARRAAVAKAVPLCCDILPLTTSLVAAAIVDHTRDRYRPLPLALTGVDPVVITVPDGG